MNVHVYLQPGIFTEDGGVDTLGPEFDVVELSEAAHQVWAAFFYPVLPAMHTTRSVSVKTTNQSSRTLTQASYDVLLIFLRDAFRSNIGFYSKPMDAQTTKGLAVGIAVRPRLRLLHMKNLNFPTLD